jgi:hypothetical protein
MVTVNRDAETFLARLASHLRSLSFDEREALLLELRGHLLERQQQGPDHLRAALDEMGAPEILAREFVEANRIAMRRNDEAQRPVLLPSAIANSNLSSIYHRGVPRLAIREVMQDFRATLAATSDGLWGACAFLVAGFTITGFITTLQSVLPGHIAAPAWLILSARLGIAIIGSAAAYRCILGADDKVWHLDLPLIRYGFASLLLMLAMLGSSSVFRGGAEWLTAVTGGLMDPGFHMPMAVIGWVGMMLFVLRLQPWAISLAMDRPISSLSSWRGTAGKGSALLAAWAIVVAPPLLAHFGLYFGALRLPPDVMISFGLLISFIDGVVAMAVTIASTMLNAMVFRWVAREPIPAARPFSSTRPSDAQIAETNMRFRRFLAEKKQRDIEAILQETRVQSL